jgi:site-specific recombinase XerD
VKRLEIYDYKERLERELRAIKGLKGISKENKDLIIDFHRYCFAEGLSIPRVIFYTKNLRYIARLLGKPFKDATKEDMIDLLQKIERADYSEWTKQGYKVTLKKFYRWLRGTQEDPEEVRWIKTNVKNNNHLLPEEILTKEEVLRLADATDNPRDRALILTLYESGCRIGELLTLRLKNVQFDEHGACLIVNGKTGMRRVRVIAASSALATWVRNHPFKDNPNSPLWVNIGTTSKNEPMKYPAIQKLMRKLEKKSAIKKRLYPHMFRHSRASHLASVFTEAQMKEYLGWVQSSDMAAVYVHLSGRDVDDTLLKVHGLKSGEEEEKEKFKARKCDRCEYINEPMARFCVRCGQVLDVKTAIELEERAKEAEERVYEILEEIAIRDPKLLVQIMKEKGWGERCGERG